MRRRVFITGIGMVSPHGRAPESVFERLCAGESAIRKLRSGTEELGADVLLAPAELNIEGVIPKTQAFAMDRVAQMAVVAAHDALRAAGLTEAERSTAPAETAVYLGCGLGGSQAIQDAYRTYYERRSRRIKPTTVPLIMANAPAAHVSMRFGLRGPTYTYSIACASSAVAIGEALRAVRDGYIDTVVAGGAESMVNDGALCAWEMLGVLAKEHPEGAMASSRPFSVDRSGFVLGEGAACLVMECEESMRARGVAAIAELVGYGCASDAHNLTQPSVDGQARAMSMALRDGRVEPAQVGYINAHATATPTGDNVEIAAIKQTFDRHAKALAISSTKSMHGHLVGAAGALECAITAMALQRRRIPPTAFLREPDPACDLDCVPCEAREARGIEYAMSNSFAFGGTDAALILRRA